MGLHLLIVLVCLRVVTFIYPVPIYTKDILNHTSMFSSMATITSEAWTNQSPKNVNTYPHTNLLSSKTMRGSLFPLLPLRVKCQNHERVPISPILVVHRVSACQDMGHQNRGNRDPFMVVALHQGNVLTGWIDIGHPFMVLALHQGKTLRGSLFPLFPLRVKCQNHERVPISSISPILVVHVLARWKDRPWK